MSGAYPGPSARLVEDAIFCDRSFRWVPARRSPFASLGRDDKQGKPARSARERLGEAKLRMDCRAPYPKLHAACVRKTAARSAREQGDPAQVRRSSTKHNVPYPKPHTACVRKTAARSAREQGDPAQVRRPSTKHNVPYPKPHTARVRKTAARSAREQGDPAQVRRPSTKHNVPYPKLRAPCVRKQKRERTTAPFIISHGEMVSRDARRG